MNEQAYYRRRSCRLCGSNQLSQVLSLTPTPPANAFVTEDAALRPQSTYPLELSLCRDCGHLQLIDIVDPKLLFEDYVYVSGTSQAFVQHFRDYAETISRQANLKPGNLVVEIGSNDGTLLRFFKQKGARTLGVDPARDIAAQSTAAGIETWAEFFCPATATRIRKELGPARLVCANNVFAHIDDLPGAAAGVRELLADDGLFVFEVSYLLDVYRKTLFDTIYHEHLDYHRVGPLRQFLGTQGLALVDVVRVPTHGGSLRGLVRRADGDARPAPAVAELERLEHDAGLDQPDTFHGFGLTIRDHGNKLTDLLHRLRAEGHRIAGYGAPAKATTLMHHFGLGREVIEFIVDDSPWKQGLFTPGTHIPVLPPDALYEHRPDHVVILAWNFADTILAKHAPYLEAGGHFIVPLPDLAVH